MVPAPPSCRATPKSPWRDANLHAGVVVRIFQTLDQDLLQAERPATELPRIYARGDWKLDGALPLNYGVDTEATYFRHPGEEQGWRLDAEPRIGLDYSGPGLLRTAGRDARRRGLLPP